MMMLGSMSQHAVNNNNNNNNKQIYIPPYGHNFRSGAAVKEK